MLAKFLFLGIFIWTSAISLYSYMPGLRETLKSIVHPEHKSAAMFSLPLDFGNQTPFVILGLGMIAIVVWLWRGRTKIS
jgi:hypothetical protein